MKLYLCLAAMALMCGTAMADEKFVDLGVQITHLTVQGSTFGKEGSRDVIYTVIRGEPAKLLAFDARSGERLHVLELAGAKGAWNATTASDGSIYVGSDDNGHLYRYLPGEEKVSDLGQVLSDQTFVWDVTPGKDGEVFGGTYPGCNVFRYHPKDGFSDVGHGSVAAGENYARSVSYDPDSGKIFVGVGAHAHLIELDPKTGEKKDILPKQYAEKTFVYTVDALAGKIFATITNGSDAVVMNAKTHEIEATLNDVSTAQIVSPKSPYDDLVYFSTIAGISSYDLKSRNVEVIAGSESVLALTWLKLEEPDFPGETLIGLTRSRTLIRFHPPTKKHSKIPLKDVPNEPVPLTAIERGPDGRIWTGGYLVGGAAAFDPKTGKSQMFRPMSQPEDITSVGDTLYFGVYPGARLYALDTTRAWDNKGNPKQIGQLHDHDQDRPAAMLGVEKLKKVFIGTVPGYGKLGGALSTYDIGSGELKVFRNVVDQQAIVSLVSINDLIVGSTSTTGGLGITPTTNEGKIFLWDPVAEKKVFETVPVPGMKAVTRVIVGPDKKIWGMAGGTLFIFDVNQRKVLEMKKLFDIDYHERESVWRDAFLEINPNGQIYGIIDKKFFKLDPVSKAVTVLREGGPTLLAQDDAGRIYFHQGTHLWQYTP